MSDTIHAMRWASIHSCRVVCNQHTFHTKALLKLQHPSRKASEDTQPLRARLRMHAQLPLVAAPVPAAERGGIVVELAQRSQCVAGITELDKAKAAGLAARVALLIEALRVTQDLGLQGEGVSIKDYGC
jgi:hypothetical protein